MTTLYIAEKPELARAIVAGLIGDKKTGNGFTQVGKDTYVTWCYGHLFEFKSPEEINPDYKRWDINTLPMALMPIPIQPVKRAAAQAAVILKLLKKATYVINAGDP
ncbi:DNA topoisomerase III [Photobacterium phosphoreum]|uniref:toprim domain-containing protein n=1 Tax=Photobacterium phosphoreum TaxID=659 RepID=UPI000D162896|nr:toprim domain-containing protein [Photobacterium phosphoreum]PSW31196.1 DNA topoisomerase III [Photobacterium phosphoreum]